MIWIKRIASTPAPQGHIIDSFETGDDKSTNAPSIRAVAEKLNTKVEIDDSTYTSDKTLSGEKIKQMFDSVDGVALDDTAPRADAVYSSSKVMSELDALTTALLDRFYPVGCVVMSFTDMTNEQVVARYGGTTWQRIQGRYLIAADSSHTVGTTGGSKTVTLSVDNLPSHSHTYSRSSTSTGSHTLTINEMPSHSHSSFDGGSYWGTDWVDNNHQYTCRSSGSNLWTPETSKAGGGGSHYHSITRSSVNSGYTGNGTAINIEPPYLAIYM